MLDPKLCLGPIDPATIPANNKRVTDKERKDHVELPSQVPEGALNNLHDIKTSSPSNLV
jgi:hypothetical protein